MLIIITIISDPTEVWKIIIMNDDYRMTGRLAFASYDPRDVHG